MEHHSKIHVSDPRANDAELDVGELDAIHAQFGLAVNNGISWLDVLDAHSEEASEYCALLENDSTWKEDVGEVGNLDLLILESCIIKPEFRGHGLGLLAAKCAIDAFAESCGVVGVVPFPMDFSGFQDPNWVPPAGVTAENKERAFRTAKMKMEMYWSRLGLTQYNDRIWILLTAHVSPSAEEIFQGLRAPLPAQVRNHVVRDTGTVAGRNEVYSAEFGHPKPPARLKAAKAGQSGQKRNRLELDFQFRNHQVAGSSRRVSHLDQSVDENAGIGNRQRCCPNVGRNCGQCSRRHSSLSSGERTGTLRHAGGAGDRQHSSQTDSTRPKRAGTIRVHRRAEMSPNHPN